MEETNVIKSPVKAIRAYCLGCCYGSANEVKLCPITNCELYPFRFGKNPFRTQNWTEEQKAEAKKRLLNGKGKNNEERKPVDFITGE